MRARLHCAEWLHCCDRHSLAHYPSLTDGLCVRRRQLACVCVFVLLLSPPPTCTHTPSFLPLLFPIYCHHRFRQRLHSQWLRDRPALCGSSWVRRTARRIYFARRIQCHTVRCCCHSPLPCFVVVVVVVAVVTMALTLCCVRSLQARQRTCSRHAMARSQ